MPHAEDRDFKQHDRANEQKGCRHMTGQSRSNARAGDRANRRAGCDEAEQTLALFGIEGVYDKRPEHRHDEQVKNCNPDEKRTHDPNGLLGIGEMQRDREQQDVGGEEPVSDRDEPRARQRFHEKGVRNIEHQHADQRAVEKPLQIVDAPGAPHLVADRTHDVIRGEYREYVEPGPAQYGCFAGPDLCQPPQEGVEKAAGACFGAGGFRSLCHWVTPSALRNSETDIALPNSGLGGANSLARASGTSTGSKPASRTICAAIFIAPASSPAIATPSFSPDRCASLVNLPAPVELNARTRRVPGRSSASASPTPFSCAALATSPSRDGIGFEAFSTTFPASAFALSRPTCSRAE